ncbi:MAG TPA: hypothetical protein VF069_09755 [Streptosporangiaceae bacterium]
MTALIRFQVTGYVRSQRALYPMIVVACFVILVLVQSPGQEHGAALTVGTFGDIAAFMVPIWGWTARALLDTAPDVQADLSALAVGRRTTATIAGLISAYGMNVALAAVMVAVPLVQAFAFHVGGPAMLAGVALQPLAAGPATLLGAWTCRAVIRSPALSALALVGGCLVLLVLSMGPLAWLSIPMVGWLRAAHHDEGAFTAGFPGLAVHLVLWWAAAAAVYIWFRRR